jgi:hypothetical protein
VIKEKGCRWATGSYVRDQVNVQDELVRYISPWTRALVVVVLGTGSRKSFHSRDPSMYHLFSC